MRIFSTTGTAKLLGVHAWRIKRLYEEGVLPPPAMIGRRRVITSADLADIVIALKKKGWLPQQREVLAVEDGHSGEEATNETTR